MGYYMHQRESNFFLPKEKQHEALEAVKDAGRSKPKVFGSNILQAQTLQEVLDWWCWKPQFDKDGNIEALHFEGNKSGVFSVRLYEMICFRWYRQLWPASFA